MSTLLSILGFVLLLCLSPCNVRKYLQAELNLPQMEVSNKNKASVSINTCDANELSDDVFNSSKRSVAFLSFVALDHPETTASPIAFRELSDTFPTSKARTVSFAPYYILYQNFQGYL